MKTETIRVIIMYIATLLLLLLSDVLRAEEKNQFALEGVWPKSLHSDHEGDFKNEANEDNGGVGMILHYKRLDKYINVAAGKICFDNSYGDPGCAIIFQPHAMDYEFVLFNSVSLFAELAIWFMEITGYKDEYRTENYYVDKNGESRNVKRYEEKIVRSPPWPVPRIGINPLYKFTKDFRIDWRQIEFISVKINFVTLTYRMRF